MSTMTKDETYNGWANRETWAFNLHWQNDQGLYNMVLEDARRYLEDLFSGPLSSAELDAAERGLGEHVVKYLEEELAELSPELWELMRSDVGSFWRIDYAEVGKAVRESLDNEN